MLICEMQYTIIHKGADSPLNISACYLWKMALNEGLNASFDNMHNWKEIQEKRVEINSMKAYITTSR
jgi:hypothetical protein